MASEEVGGESGDEWCVAARPLQTGDILQRAITRQHSELRDCRIQGVFQSNCMKTERHNVGWGFCMC